MILLLPIAVAMPIESEFRSRGAARVVIETRYAAIDRGRDATACRLWPRGGRASGRTSRACIAGFAGTRTTHVIADPPVHQEGAAGSVFVTVPVGGDAMLNDGTRQRFSGRYMLRRVNGVNGAAVDQRRWRMASATLRPTR